MPVIVRQKRRSSNSPACHGKTNDSGTSKEDANEENGKKTPRRGSPCKQSLDKDVSKTSSGRSRLRRKSPTDSPKKSSSSSQGHVSNETDEESDDDVIKPVSSAKKARKIYSSDDSDAAETSSGKQKGSDNDDKSNDEKDVTKSSKSSKKKVKRIKKTSTQNGDREKHSSSGSDTDSSSSSSSSGSDTDSCCSSSSSDTHSYHSGHGNIIQQLRAIQKEDDGMLNLLQYYILWFALKAGGEDCDDGGEDCDDELKEICDAKKRLDGRLEQKMNICVSQAWGADFSKDVKAYPQFNDYVKHEDLSGGDMRHLGNCEVCNRENHPWSVIVRLEGEPYNRETFETFVREEGEDIDELPPVEYYMGCFCHPRTKLFHKLYHFGHYLYHRCKKMLEELGEDEEKIAKVATDKSLLIEMYNKLKKWMEEADTDYTKDGRRANNKWIREYDSLN
ncbi:uncharacterized protein LOC123537477 [Mercenaria mercenaria]|uniref:uncharacterized protein LOC123537477 n=1 Tax=Mercenaria mercenaria TaxID=6596 RepID=UPI00234E7AF9|nr:uncharacterized protein LOC123537477 [Mercenaria mercenaria]